jgi:josephin
MVELYHERQRLSLCAVHAVNNLMQTHRYTKRDFDVSCLALSPDVWLNPHRSFWRIGDYDVNVITILMQQEGFCIAWHDHRAALKPETLENLVGVLWNVGSTSLWGRVFGGRHWIAFLRSNDQWINLDSDLTEPTVVGTHADCICLLNSKPDAHTFLVTREVFSQK